jgi:hypothetical protein
MLAAVLVVATLENWIATAPVLLALAGVLISVWSVSTARRDQEVERWRRRRALVQEQDRVEFESSHRGVELLQEPILEQGYRRRSEGSRMLPPRWLTDRRILVEGDEGVWEVDLDDPDAVVRLLRQLKRYNTRLAGPRVGRGTHEEAPHTTDPHDRT